jgi:prevent-host-death family protein
MAMSGRQRKAEVGAAEFKARCLELVDRVKETRAELIVTRHGRPVARLVPAETAAIATPLGVMQGTVVSYEQPFDPIPGAWMMDSRDGS